jgi:hypothetical protein
MKKSQKDKLRKKLSLASLLMRQDPNPVASQGLVHTREDEEESLDSASFKKTGGVKDDKRRGTASKEYSSPCLVSPARGSRKNSLFYSGLHQPFPPQPWKAVRVGAGRQSGNFLWKSPSLHNRYPSSSLIPSFLSLS